jgi:hypothetical protein
MTDQSDPITSSLARVYADQGHLRKAALIYQRLLSTAPDCREYAVALEAIESQLSRSTEAGSEEETALVDRFCQWIELAQGNSRIEQLLALRSGGSSR